MQILEKKEVASTLVQQAGLADLKANVILGVDRSVSIQDLYDDGSMQTVVETSGAIALALDPDGKLPVIVFSDTATELSVPLTAANCDGYVNKYISEIDYGGTAYTPVIQKAVALTGAVKQKQITYMKAIKSKGFLGFGAKNTAKETKEDIWVGSDNKPLIPTLLIIATDGDNDPFDKPEFRSWIVRASKYPLFVACLGVEGNPKPSFEALKEVDLMEQRFIDNVSFTPVSAAKLKTMSTEEFMKGVLGEFLTKYVPTARKQFLIKP